MARDPPGSKIETQTEDVNETDIETETETCAISSGHNFKRLWHDSPVLAAVAELPSVLVWLCILAASMR